VKLFDLSPRQAMGRRLAARLSLPLAEHEDRPFEEGEFKVRPLESVRGESVYVCQSLTAEAALSVNDKLMRLAFFIGALHESGATRVTAVLPYLAYQRKDRRTQPRDPVSTRYLARMLEAVGLDAVVAIDVHNLAAFDNAFQIPKLHLSAAPLFVEHFAPMLAKSERTVVVSPDIGGVARARLLAGLMSQRLGRDVDVAFVEKHRSGGVVTGDLFAGDVERAVAIVIDDMVCGGTTMVRAATACMQRGAAAVHVAATHGLFSPDAGRKLGDAPIASVVVTDTIPDAVARCAELAARLVVLDSAELLAAALQRLNAGAVHPVDPLPGST
jgi:ribose-phosphate pyrophosphokinase